MEIPDDVRAAARKCLASWGPRGNIDLEAAISQALMAERETIAAFIEQRSGSIPDRQEIASEIRKGRHATRSV